MIRDVFYLNSKPNVHPRERAADSLEHARQLSTTDQFWVINEFCDYRNFNWEWDFAFLNDGDVWAEEHNNVWPSKYQKDSGTWLCPKELSEVVIYRVDVDPLSRKNELNSCWKVIENIDTSLFDFGWHPDPMDPLYIYSWGNKWYPCEVQSVVEFHTPGATDYKYMTNAVEVLPQTDRWKELQPIDKSKFDLSWRPDPREPPFIYVWGNKWISGELRSTLEYHCPEATEIKYMEEPIEVLPESDRWHERQEIDKSKFDMSWRPDPREPPYIYVWGNKWIAGELQATLEYVCPDATERKYMEDLIEVLPEQDRWHERQPIDKSKFDLSWRPDPREPAYIYVWGNKWISAELQSTLEYVCPGATERKYMPELIEVTPEMDRWKELQLIDKNNFDLSWRPDPREPAYIYVWGNKWISAELRPTLEYHCPEATEIKYMTTLIDVLPEINRWHERQLIDKSKFDLSWRPDPREPPYIYVWGNKWISGELQATLEYVCPDATERKYMEDLIEVLPEQDRWERLVPVMESSFDFSWRPDPREPPFIYVWGNQHNCAEIDPTVKYHAPDSSEQKFMSDLIRVAPVPENWTERQQIDKSKFDMSWRPDPTSPPYIYVWGNKWIPGELQSTLEYVCPDATERKYMSELVEVLPETDRWQERQLIDKTTFDLTWRPDPREPPFIYVWGNKWISGELQSTLEYVCPDATERKYMEEPITVLPELERWQERQLIDKSKFDLSWRPDPREPAFIYVWGNKWIPGELQSTLEYVCPDATERKYMPELVEVLPEQDRWKERQPIDKIKFDLSWRPDPREPPFIYVWGNKWIPGELQATIEYVCPDATERKYMDQPVVVLSESDRWQERQEIDKSKFDLTWRPDPREPPFIYVWGNKWISAELQSTLEYVCPGATERKYMEELIEVLPETDRWKERQLIDKSKFDLTWRPDPREPPFIYVWGNKWISGELQATLEYICPGASERKYMPELVEVLPETELFELLLPIKQSAFDFTWRPDPSSPPYIYVWGNQHNLAEVEPTIRYTVEGATENKFMKEIAEVLPDYDRWKERQTIDKTKFDFTWRPDPGAPPYIYVWGNKWISGELQATLEYVCPDATERKYMEELIDVLPELNKWQERQSIDKSKFDLTWRPDPREPPFIYVWGNKWIPGELQSTLEYVCPDATERKYMPELVEVLPESNKWQERQLIVKSKFDLSWRPDPREPAFIYVWGNKWIPGELQSTLEYVCPDATERKYMPELVEVLPEQDRWKERQLIDKSNFDMSWRPDPREPPYIYIWGNKWIPGQIQSTMEYICPDATDYKFMPALIDVLPEMDRWTIQGDAPTFDFSWRPGLTSKPQIYQWPNNGPRYTVPGASPEDIILMNFTDETTLAIKPEKKVNSYNIKTTLAALIAEHPTEVFWALNSDLSYTKFDFSWRPEKHNERFVNVFGNKYSKDVQTYFVNGPAYLVGYKDFNYIEVEGDKIEADLSMFWVDKGNPESAARFEQLRAKLPRLQKTRFLNSWVDTINRCVNKSETGLFWVLNSELDYTGFEFDFYPGAWQMKMVHVFGTQWSNWGNTYMINRETFAKDTKYVKIVEHLNILNFVKTKKTRATNCLYDVVIIDHGNDKRVNDKIKSKINDRSIIATVPYDTSYLQTLRNMMEVLPVKKDHYLWVCSSICDYSRFDFTYICDPFAREQFHVFPSDKQKFGDTFLVDVNKLRELISDMEVLEDYTKINYNDHQRAKRMLPPIITVNDDTHCQSMDAEFNFPYAVFETEEVSVIDTEPMSIWTPETKTIIVTTTGGTRIIVPKEAKSFVKKELYDYPYIKKSTTLAKSMPLDIVFLSNGESGADENYEHLKKVTDGLENRLVRVDGVNGRVAAYHAAAAASETPWMFTVFAKLKVSNRFDWNWQPDRLQVPKHYIFHATNPVNNLVYGHQACIAYNKKLVLANTGHGLDFTMDDVNEVVEVNSGVANYNTDAWSTWRTAFRECIKLKAGTDDISKQRLNTWMSVATGEFSEWSIYGAKDAVEFYNDVDGDTAELLNSYDWAWLRDHFESLYPNSLNGNK